MKKTFGGIRALKGVDLDIFPGEVHVVLGENGAGKSTLMKVLSGIYPPTAGEVFLGDEAHDRLTPAQAAAAGISIIYQELSVINELSALENLFVGRLPMRRQLFVPTVDWGGGDGTAGPANTRSPGFGHRPQPPGQGSTHRTSPDTGDR
ncbi:ATP-binding cassette domain-containing protein [Sinorhizobium meliloti]|nr:ATP-binding cassette domain-containing protein [Sinorhizobium meliloti]